MKNLITYLKTLWSWVADSQSTDVSLDRRRSDLRRSPSGLDAKWKQNPFMRFAVVLTLIFTIGIGNVWGDTQPFDPSTDKGTITKNGTSSGDSFTKNGFTISSSNGVLGNGSNYRVYNGGTFSISSSVGTITAISFTFSSTYTGGLSSSYTGLSTTSWSANATSQARITAITVTYTPAASCTKIGAPTVTATPGDGRIDLSWSNQTGASSYSVTKTPSGGSVGTPSKSGSTWSCAITGLTNGTTYTWSVEAVGSGDYCASGNTAASASATPNVYYTVTWMNNGSSYTTTSVESGQKPTFPDNPSSCDGTSTTFIGWTPTPWSGKLDDVSSKTIYSSGSSMPDVSGPVTYHAVFAKSIGSGTTTQAATLSTSNPIISGSGWATSTSGTYSGPYLKLDSDGKNVTFTSPKGAISRFQFTYKLQPSSSCTGHSGTNWWIGDVKFYVSTDWGSNWSELTTKSINDINTGSGLQTDVAKDYDDLSSGGYNAIKVQLSKSCGNLGIKGLSATYANVTYSEYLTTCCTPLGSINGSVSLTQGGNSVTISGWSDVSNVGTYTVKMYKKNGASWDPVSGTASGGSAGTAGTRTGITSGSKSVTYTGLEVESEYKFTVQAIAGSAAYCDGEETAVTEINSTDVSSTPFKFRYSIYIDNGSNSGWTHHYITPTGNTDEGSITIDLNAHVDYYQFKIAGGLSGWWGQTTNDGKIEATTVSDWTLDGDKNVRLKTGAAGDYVFTVDYSGTTNPKVGVEYPSADQDAGYVIYYDNSILNWSSLYYRIGNNSNCSKVDAVLVTGTDKFYKITTPDYDNMDAWHIANNYGWTGSNSVYRTKTNSTPAEAAKAITNSISFQQYVVTGDITVIPTTTHSTGGDTGDAGNNNCEFYTINTPTSGMLTHNISVGSADHGTVVATYTNTSGTTGQTVAEGANADLAHRCIVTITATPDAGYSCTSLTLNGAAFTSGNTHILTADATIAATFTAQTSTVTLDNNNATSGSSQTVTATYDAAMPLTTTSSTPVAALSRTGYTFTGWRDATSGGTQYYSYNAGTGVIASARTWNKTGAQTLKAQWSINSYTLTWATVRGKVTTAGTGAAVNATGNVSSSQQYNTALTAPVLGGANGYTFTGWSPTPASNMPAENTTYTAQWSANQYTVTLNNHGATTAGTTSVTATFDAAMPAITPPEKTGYRFDGYYTAASGGTKYYNTDGTSATVMKLYGASPTLHAHWVAQLKFSVNGVIDDELTRDDNTAMPSTAAVPTACGDCWAFMGWSTNSSESGAPAYAGGATHEFGEPTTLYAVFGKAEYQMITSTSELEANDYYVVASSTEWALSNADHSYYNTSNYYTHTDAASTDISSISKSNASGYYIYNPPASIIWKLTGTKDAGQLQNVATPAKYVNLTATNLLATAQDLKFSVSSDGESWIIQYSTTNFLHGYTDSKGNGFETLSSSNWEEGDYSAFLYRQISAEYATEPSCETYTITWMVNGVAYTTGSPTEETNTCTGIETLPTAPSNSTLDCADRFMGWSESTLTGTGKSAPADLFISAKDAPIINENKTFHAVFAKGEAGGSGSVVLSYTSLGLTTSYESGSTKTVSDIDFYCNDIMTGTSGQDGYQKIQFKKSSTGPGYLYNSEAMPGNITSIVFESTTRNMTVNFGTSSNPDGSAETKTCSSGSLTATPTGSYNYFKILNAADNAAYTGTITINYTDVTYNNYVTSCCDKNITIGTPSITGGGTVTFTLGGDAIAPGDEVETCSGAKNVVATVTPAAGYSCTALSFSGGSVSVDPTPGAGNYPSAPSAQNYTLSFGANTTSATLSTTATFTAKALEGWTWMYKKDADVADDSVDPYAIPDVVEIYKDQYARFIITGYAPADVIAEKQGYVYSAGGVEPAYTTDYLTRVANTATYFTLKGKNPVESTTITFKAVGDASITRTMTIRVKALPLVHFVDNVHNVAFDDVVATVTTGVVTLTKKTPTQDDFDGSTKNTCEETHLHLVGWIDGEWEPYQAYMDGTGEKPTASAIIGATGYFYAPNADIDLVAKDGHTYYAVWANVE